MFFSSCNIPPFPVKYLLVTLYHIYTDVVGFSIYYADVAELADAPDLGSGVYDVQVQVLSSAVYLNHKDCKGTSPVPLHTLGWKAGKF